MKRYLILYAAFALAACNSGERITTARIQEPYAAVVAYCPAPGQYINEATWSDMADVTTPEAAIAYAERRMAAGRFVSLGAWGGYIAVAFRTPVEASADDYDLYVEGNAFGANASEPGVVWVAADTDGDGSPEGETWYELRGSVPDAEVVRGYRIVYERPDGANMPVRWTDDRGGSGEVGRIAQHPQASYYPAWVEEAALAFEGTLLPSNVREGTIEGGQGWLLDAFAWGYADNVSPTDGIGRVNRFRIRDAVTAAGEAARLEAIDFVKVQTGVRDWRTMIGEVSTEVCGIGCYRTVPDKR